MPIASSIGGGRGGALSLNKTGATQPTSYAGSTTAGAPTTGTFAVGDFVVGADGSIWVCTVAGTPGTWVDTATIGPSVSSVFTRTGAVVAGNADYLAVATGGLTGATQATRYVGATASGAPASGTFAIGDFVVDRTGYVWICVTAGTPGTWTNATKSRLQLAQSAAGILTETASPLLHTSSAAFTTQTVYGYLLGLKAGDVVNGLLMRNTTAAATANPTTCRVGIADSTGKILQLSNNLNAAANFPLGPCALSLSATYTVPSDGGYYACIVVNGVWGTPPTPIRFTTAAAQTIAYSTNAPPSFLWSGQTDLPAINSSVTLTTGNTLCHYMAFY